MRPFRPIQLLDRVMWIAMLWAFVGNAGCASVISQVLEKPEVKFQGLSIRDANAEGATAVVGLDIHNPNGVGLQLDEVQYRLELAGREVARAKMDRAVSLEAKSTSRVEIPVPFLYNQVFQSLLDLMKSGTAAYKVSGSARLGIFELPFENGGDVKLR
jgi:LEA14-like dessication related protein